MAELNLDPLVNRVRGKLGNFVYKQVGNSVYIAKRPSFNNHEPSASQLEVRDKFKRASAYGKAVMADPQAKAVYAAVAATKELPLFSVIMTDYLKAPEVVAVDLSGYTGQIGEKIAVRATDDFEVISVVVEISTANAGVAETTPTVRSTVNPEFWEFTAAANATGGGQIQVKVTASDRPGNKTIKTETK